MTGTRVFSMIRRCSPGVWKTASTVQTGLAVPLFADNLSPVCKKEQARALERSIIKAEGPSVTVAPPSPNQHNLPKVTPRWVC